MIYRDYEFFRFINLSIVLVTDRLPHLLFTFREHFHGIWRRLLPPTWRQTWSLRTNFFFPYHKVVTQIYSTACKFILKKKPSLACFCPIFPQRRTAHKAATHQLGNTAFCRPPNSNESNVTRDLERPNPRVCSGFHHGHPPGSLKKLHSDVLTSAWHMFSLGHLYPAKSVSEC